MLGNGTLSFIYPATLAGRGGRENTVTVQSEAQKLFEAALRK